MFNTRIRKLLLGIFLAAILIAGIIIAVLFFGFNRLTKTYGISSSVIGEIFRQDYSRLQNSEGRTNIVLLGMGGEGHESGDLTDTIMIASFDLVKKDILLITLPRDIWVPSMADKLNSAYHYGEKKESGKGLELVKTAITEVTKIPVHYVILLDFSGFVSMIDVLGGIDVDVTESFVDTQFPISGKENDLCNGDIEFKCRYETVTFTKGLEHMDGSRALVYVRSRHAGGDEGTDFSRGIRQQAVLFALKEKLLSFNTITNKKTITSFMQTANESILSTQTSDETILLGSSFIHGFTIRSVSLTQELPQSGYKGLLINPLPRNYGGRWVLVPKHNDNFVRIGEYLKCEMFQTGECEKLIQ